MAGGDNENREEETQEYILIRLHDGSFRRYRYKPPTPDPTPEQIRERCQEIQARWTPMEEQHRRRWSLPHERVELEETPSNFGDTKKRRRGHADD